MLENLLSPKSIAVIGASKSKGKVGHEIVHNLVADGYTGTIIPVNPTADEICGLKCYPSLLNYDQRVELAIVVVPKPAVMAAVESAFSCGVKAITVITAGYKEVDEEGAQHQAALADACRERRVRLLGPNCLGVLNTHAHMNASFAKHMPPQGGISVISQSGALCTAILDWAASRKLGMAKLVSMGNKADLGENDFIRAFAEDEKTRVIVGYLESIDDGNAFMEAAEEASARKPIVIFKSGVTSAGGKAASSHTGSLAGADIAYGAAFKRSGVVRADTFEAMLDFAMAFAMQPLPKGDHVAIITNAGGPGIMAADAAELAGMKVTPLSKSHASALRAKLPKAASVSNPIDVLGDADPQRFVEAVNAAKGDDTIHAIVVILTPQAMTDALETARQIAKCADGSKPILVSFMGGLDVQSGRDELVLKSLPDYPSPERAVNALKAMWDYASWLDRPPRILTRFKVNRRRVRRIISRHLKMGQMQLGEASAKGILKAYDFNIPNGAMASSADEAAQTAKQIGFPVAMKIASPDIIHKSDAGGVKLNLGTEEAVQDAFDLMMMRIGQRAPNATIDGVYIERMCKRGREVILGMTRDPQFGSMLMFGLGGIFVEVMKDVAFNIAPITHAEAMQMLESTKSFALLQGARGLSSADIAAIASGLQKISQLVTEFPQIVELDINPFMVGEMGEDSIAADARITIAKIEA